MKKKSTIFLWNWELLTLELCSVYEMRVSHLFTPWPWHLGWVGVGFKNKYELINLKALKFSTLYESYLWICGLNILCVVSMVPFEIPHKITYPYIEWCVVWREEKIKAFPDLWACKRFWNYSFDKLLVNKIAHIKKKIVYKESKLAWKCEGCHYKGTHGNWQQ